ncbi:MAG: LCP family protein [Bacilli bacterium]|nr:LCP family protein [Bacilli bacterium]
MVKARKILLIIILSLVGVVVTLGSIAGGYFLFAQGSKTERAQNVPKEHEIIYIDGEKYIAKDTVNYLVVGIDSTGEMKASNGYNNTALNDLICLVSFNLTDSSYTIIPISRDTMVEVDVLGLSGKVIGSKYTQIDYAHTVGDGLDMSFRNTCRAASKVLMGVDIERYIGINMTTVPLLNDFLGGVTITLEEDLTVIDPTWEEGATITLTGDTCLKYLRARMEVGDGTQISRMRRQQVYMEELVRKARTNDYTFSDILDALHIVNNYVCMDVTYMDMADILNYVKTFHYNGIKQIKGYTQKNKGLIEFIPYEEDLKELVISTFYDKAPEE